MPEISAGHPFHFGFIMNILIGSRALNYWFPEAQVRPQSDWDIISNDPIDGSEWHDPAILYNQEFADR